MTQYNDPLLRCSHLSLETNVVFHATVVSNVLKMATVLNHTVAVASLNVFLTAHVREAPLLRHNDLLATSELVPRATQRLNGIGAEVITRADRQEHLANVHTSHETVWLTEGATHTRLQTVSTGAGKHLVDTDDVVRVNTDTQVERILTGRLGHVLVSTDTRGLQSLGRDLLVLVTDQVHTEWEFVYRCLLTTQIVDTDLWVWHTTVVPGLGLKERVSMPAYFSMTAGCTRYIRKACSCSNGNSVLDDVPSSCLLVDKLKERGGWQKLTMTLPINKGVVRERRRCHRHYAPCVLASTEFARMYSSSRA